MASCRRAYGYDRYRVSCDRPPARTPDSAVRGLLEGQSEPEDLYEAIGRVRPLVSRPQDPAALDRALARWSPGTGDLALGFAFRDLLSSPDQDTALHGAESLSVMEVRYAREIEKTRETGNLSRRATLYVELAELSGTGGSLGTFYLREAMEALMELSRSGGLGRDELLIAVRVQVALGRPDMAIRYIRKGLEALPRHLPYLEALADLQFRTRDYAALAETVKRLADMGVLEICHLAAAARRWA